MAIPSRSAPPASGFMASPPLSETRFADMTGNHGHADWRPYRPFVESSKAKPSHAKCKERTNLAARWPYASWGLRISVLGLLPRVGPSLTAAIRPTTCPGKMKRARRTGGFGRVSLRCLGIGGEVAVQSDDVSRRAYALDRPSTQCSRLPVPNKCGRAGRYRREGPVDRHGPNTPLPDLSRSQPPDPQAILRPRSLRISRAALWPGTPVTPPPGWAEAPQR